MTPPSERPQIAMTLRELAAWVRVAERNHARSYARSWLAEQVAGNDELYEAIMQVMEAQP